MLAHSKFGPQLSTLNSQLFGGARMHTVELLQEAVEAARRLGYEVRQDWLGGDGGGHCIVRGQVAALGRGSDGRRAARRGGRCPAGRVGPAPW